MQTQVTITPNFQVHIPVSIRRSAKLLKHGKAFIRTENSKIIIEPIKSSFISLAGTFKVKNPIKAEKIRGIIDYTDDKK